MSGGKHSFDAPVNILVPLTRQVLLCTRLFLHTLSKSLFVVQDKIRAASRSFSQHLAQHSANKRPRTGATAGGFLGVELSDAVAAQPRDRRGHDNTSEPRVAASTTAAVNSEGNFSRQNSYFSTFSSSLNDRSSSSHRVGGSSSGRQQTADGFHNSNNNNTSNGRGSRPQQTQSLLSVQGELFFLFYYLTTS